MDEARKILEKTIEEAEGLDERSSARNPQTICHEFKMKMTRIPRDTAKKTVPRLDREMANWEAQTRFSVLDCAQVFFAPPHVFPVEIMTHTRLGFPRLIHKLQ